MRFAHLPVALSLFVATFTGCGASSPTCVPGTSLGIIPASATISSTAGSPANQQQFQADVREISLRGACPISALVALVPVTWHNPDPIHISISSANDSTNGLATCLGPTAGPVTLSTSYIGRNNTATASAQLTCQ